MWIYGKVLEDTLKDEGIIIDDSNTYVTYPPTAPLLIPIEDWNNRKLVFKIINDNREILKNFKKWNASR